MSQKIQFPANITFLFLQDISLDTDLMINHLFRKNLDIFTNRI